MKKPITNTGFYSGDQWIKQIDETFTQSNECIESDIKKLLMVEEIENVKITMGLF